MGHILYDYILGDLRLGPDDPGGLSEAIVVIPPLVISVGGPFVGDALDITGKSLIKWFFAIDGAGQHMAAEIYATVYDGVTPQLNMNMYLGDHSLKFDVAVVIAGTTMSLLIANNEASALSFRAVRIFV